VGAGGVVERAHIPQERGGAPAQCMCIVRVEFRWRESGSGGGMSEDEPTSTVMWLMLH